MNTRQYRTLPSAAGRRSRFPRRPAALPLNVAPAPSAAAPLLAPAAAPGGPSLPAPPGAPPAPAADAPPLPVSAGVGAPATPGAPPAPEKHLTPPGSSYQFVTDMINTLPTPSRARPRGRRTTIRNMAFDPVLLRLVRGLARREGCSLSAWVCRAIARDLREHRVTPASPQYLGQPCALLTCGQVAARLKMAPGLVSIYSRRPGHPLHAARFPGGRKNIGMFFPAPIEALARALAEPPATPAPEPNAPGGA